MLFLPTCSTTLGKHPTRRTFGTASYVLEHFDIYLASRRACTSALTAVPSKCPSQAPHLRRMHSENQTKGSML
jgi:hypothetical protein